MKEKEKKVKNYLDIDLIAPQLSTFRRSPVEWLWESWIPLGTLTMLDGDPGKGKSNFIAWLLALVSQGGKFPDGADCTQNFCLVIDVENRPCSTILPRVLNNGGDAGVIRLIHWFVHPGTKKKTLLQIPDDLGILERVIKECGSRLVVIDTIMNHLVSSCSSRDDQKVRSALTPLAGMAEHYGCAIVLLRHLNKSSDGPAIYRGSGSIGGFLGVARAGMIVAPDPEEKGIRVLASTKGNDNEIPCSLAFKIKGHRMGSSVIEWCGKSLLDADDLVKAVPSSQEDTKLENAKAELAKMLGAGPKTFNVLCAEARDLGISVGTLRRAKTELGVESIKQGNDTGSEWIWALGGFNFEKSFDLQGGGK
jgi:hypothetical protein